MAALLVILLVIVVNVIYFKRYILKYFDKLGDAWITILFMFPLTILVIIKNFGYIEDSPLYEEISAKMFAIGASIIFVICEIKYRKIRKENETVNKKLGIEGYEQDYTAEVFYQTCLKRGINDPEKPYNLEKMQLLGKTLNISSNDYKELFYKGKDSLEKQEQIKNLKETESKVNKLKETEKKEEEENFKYFGFGGRNKRIKMLSDERETVAEEIRKIKGANELLLASSIQSKNNPYSVGGAVQGLAGPAAGVVAAVDTMNKNARIDIENSNRLSAVTGVYTASMSRVDRLALKLKELDEEIEKAKLLIVDDSNKDLLSEIEFGNENYTITESGSVRYSVSVKATKKYKIGGELDANIDGHIVVDILENEKSVGQIYLRLPLNGLHPDYTILNGICTKPFKTEATYTFKCSYGKLFLIEK